MKSDELATTCSRQETQKHIWRQEEMNSQIGLENGAICHKKLFV